MVSQCISDGCKKYPVFNEPGLTKGLYCFNHRLDGMKDVKSKK
jgi:hypothetical protein